MLLEQMTWEEVADRVARGDLLIVPIGSVEQHGPHLPLATDLYSVLEIAKLVGKEVSAVVAPPIYYTYAKPMRPFPGTVSLEGSTLILFIRDIVREFIRQGFKRILFLSGHYENSAFIQEGIQVALQTGHPDSVKVVVSTWWDLLPDELLHQIFPGEWEGWSGVHASLAETSLALALNPSLVRADKIIDDQPEERLPYAIFPTPASHLPRSGVFSRTKSSSKEIGEQLKATVLKEVLRLIDKEFN